MTRPLHKFFTATTLLMLCLSTLLGCPGSSNVKTDNTIISGRTRIQSTTKGNKLGGGCVRGQVVDEDEKGVSGVYISTQPNSSLQVTDSAGFFEICNARKVINKDTGETAKIGIVHQSYLLVVKKEGYHCRPTKFKYKGNTIKLTRIILVEKSQPLPKVSETKTKEIIRSGGTGSAPVSE